MGRRGSIKIDRFERERDYMNIGAVFGSEGLRLSKYSQDQKKRLPSLKENEII